MWHRFLLGALVLLLGILGVTGAAAPGDDDVGVASIYLDDDSSAQFDRIDDGDDEVTHNDAGRGTSTAGGAPNGEARIDESTTGDDDGSTGIDISASVDVIAENDHAGGGDDAGGEDDAGGGDDGRGEGDDASDD